MLNSQPITLPFRWQRRAFVPAFLLLLALAAVAVFWLQQTQQANADPGTYYRYYEGNATVKVKLGYAYNTYPVYTCTVVETNGPDGDITNVEIFGINTNEPFYQGSDSGEFFCGDSCLCSDGNNTLTLEGYAEPQMLPGSFFIDTWVNELETGGSGWKAKPQKQTSTQWTFTLKRPEPEAASVILNNDFRPLQANSTLLMKFIRNRGGIYWKVAGLAPMTNSGMPKGTVEIETPATGHDAPPIDLYTDPYYDNFEEVDSDTSMTVQYSEPVNVDPGGVELYCYQYGDLDFTILGQGTSTIVIDPDQSLPEGALCHLFIFYDAVTDVDTVDPPDFSVWDVAIWFYVSNPQ